MKTTRCTDCRAEFTEEELKDAMVCPECGTESIPCKISDDVTIKINWHELRILGIWASNYAGSLETHSKKALASIIGALEKQYPDKTPLTLMGELRQMQEIYPSLEARDGKGNVILPKKTVQ